MNQAKRFLVLALAVVTLSALSLAANIPNGTRVSVRTTTSLNSGTAHAGGSWDGSLAKDVVVNGTTYAHAGDPVHGVVSVAKDSGRLHAPGVLSIRVTSVAGNPVTSTAYSVKGKSHTKSNATKIGGGAAAGALIGALAGGGKGAAIGAGVGAGAGTGVAAYTGKQQAVIPSEALVAFTITNGSASSASLRKRSR